MIIQYLHYQAVDNKDLLKIVDVIDGSIKLGIQDSVIMLEEVVKYLRLKVLSTDSSTIFYTMVLIDMLMKNCGYRIHMLIARVRFMKTISIVTRRLYALSVQNYSNKKTSEFMIGILNLF